MGESSLGEIGTQQSKSLSANVNASLDVIGSYESSSTTEEENYMGKKRTVTKVDRMGKNVKTLDFLRWLELWKRQALTFLPSV